jgi:metal-responsive CopG/Arc/MetJ family transcriptional regulator
MTAGHDPDMKVAISVPDDVFQAVEQTSKELGSSRSEVFVAAAREFLERRRSRALLAALNEAHASAELAEEKRVRARSKRRYSGTLAKERW